AAGMPRMVYCMHLLIGNPCSLGKKPHVDDPHRVNLVRHRTEYHARVKRLCAATACAIAMSTPTAGRVQPASPEYLVYVASEAADKISLVRFGKDGGRLDHELGTGIMPT